MQSFHTLVCMSFLCFVYQEIQKEGKKNGRALNSEAMQLAVKPNETLSTH